jgi:hypothetical protein
MERQVKIKKGLFGGYSIGYDCPHCSTRLKSALDEAGTSQFCPACGAGFIVPGKEERDRIRAEQELEARRRRQEREFAAEQRRSRAAEREAERRRMAEEEERQKGKVVEQNRVQSVGNISQTRRCPYCSEEILSTAKKCKHCGEYLTADLRAAQARTERRGNEGCGTIIVIALGIILAVVILAFV